MSGSQLQDMANEYSAAGMSYILEKIINKKRIDAIVPVHMNGKSVDLERLSKIAKKKKIAIIEDASHAIGSEYLTSSKKKIKWLEQGSHSHQNRLSGFLDNK